MSVTRALAPNRTLPKFSNLDQARATCWNHVLHMKPDTRSFYLQAVQRVVTHVATHLDESPNLAALAQLAGLSPFHFHRVFRGMLGETPLELLRRLRLERAAVALRDSEEPVTRIAFTAGFETHEAFTRAFSAAFGTPPSAFRRDALRRTELAAASALHFSVGDAPTSFIPRDTGADTMRIELEELPTLRLGVVAHHGAYNQISTAFGKLGEIAGRAGLFAQPNALMLGVYHDDPDATPVGELRSDAGVTMPVGMPLPAGLEERRIAGGRFARYSHIGPYEQLGDVWSRFMGEGLPASEFQLVDGSALEIYRNDPTTTPPDKLHTDLLVPVV
jgi:AraC family transcriptional regulator